MSDPVDTAALKLFMQAYSHYPDITGSSVDEARMDALRRTLRVYSKAWRVAIADVCGYHFETSVSQYVLDQIEHKASEAI